MMFRNLGRRAKRLKGQEPSHIIAVARRYQSRQEVGAGRAAMTRMRRAYETLPAEFFKDFHLAMESQRELASRDASRMIFLVHAGALVALASLLGTMHSSGPSVASGVLWSGSAFLIGLVLVVVSSMLSAKSSYLYSLGFDVTPVSHPAITRVLG